ncbi:MAG: hypothetical protein SV775_18080 [Thermodesulfobacteriota bacterium]|nr:hypothetical protein [Thermodesulfobacteriota bacterium]
MRLRIKQQTKFISGMLLLIGVVLSATGQMEGMFNRCGLAAISEANNCYLKESFDRSVKGFLVLSGIKSGLAVLEGSEVGVGFNLEVGDIVQSTYDYVDIAWKTALAGGCVLLLMRLVLQTIQLFDHWFLFASMLVAMTLFLLTWLLPAFTRSCRFVKECLIFTLVLTIVLYIIMPASIAGAAFLSKRITLPLVEEANKGFERLENELTPEVLVKKFSTGNRKEESLWSSLDIKSKLEDIKDGFLMMANYLEQVTRDLAVWTIKLIAGYLFDCIVFPLAFFVAVYILTKTLLTYLFGIRTAQTLGNDFDLALGRYYGQAQEKRVPSS